MFFEIVHFLGINKTHFCVFFKFFRVFGETILFCKNTCNVLLFVALFVYAMTSPSKKPAQNFSDCDISDALSALQSSFIHADNTRTKEHRIRLYEDQGFSKQIRNSFHFNDYQIPAPQYVGVPLFIFEPLTDKEIEYLQHVRSLSIRTTLDDIPQALAQNLVSLEAPHLDMQKFSHKVFPHLRTINGAQYRSRYRSTPDKKQVSFKDFQHSSGASFYLPMYGQTIGTPFGVSARYDAVLSQFEQRKTPLSRVWLTLGSDIKNSDGSYAPANLHYAQDGMPLEWFDEDQAVEDILSLVDIAAQTQTKVILTLHSSDLYKRHADVLLDPQKRTRLIELDRQLLSLAFSKLSPQQKKWIAYVEMVNEPDHLARETDLVATQMFVAEGIDMLREVTEKPISIGPAKQYNLGYWLPFLKAGDQLQVHWYHTSEQKKDDAYLSHLTDIRALNIPENTTVILGEAQGNIGDTNIMDSVHKKAYECGYDGVLFWLDNHTSQPKYRFDASAFQTLLDTPLR